jgi:putative transcriptional regulator
VTDVPDDADKADQQLDEARLHRLGNNIRAERARKNMTQQQLANQIGVHKQTVLHIEAGDTGTSVLNIWHIADTLGLDITDLFQ